MIDEISTAGITIFTEFMKNGCMPSQRTPVHAPLHAFTHGAKLGCAGSVSMLPVCSSSMLLTDVDSITYSGNRKYSANRISAA